MIANVITQSAASTSNQGGTVQQEATSREYSEHEQYDSDRKNTLIRSAWDNIRSTYQEHEMAQVLYVHCK